VTDAEFQFWRRALRRAADLQPEIVAAILRAFQIIRAALNEPELARLIASGNLDRLFEEVLSQAILDRAMLPVQQRIRSSVERSFRYAINDLPGAGRVDRVIAVSFDYLNPRVIDAIRTLDTRVITTLTGGVRETVRAYVENGLRDGVNPRVIARELRPIVGLAPNQLTAVDNFRRALSGTNPNASPLDYALRDRRFDRTIAKGPLTPAQIDTMTDAYRKRMLSFNAETNARTAALDAMKLGQRLSWADAIDKGIVDPDRLMHQWIGVNDDRERPEHVAMNNEVQPFAEPYSNGQLVPGDGDFNCRCIDRYFVARAA
jgi:hypothetical protein